MTTNQRAAFVVTVAALVLGYLTVTAMSASASDPDYTGWAGQIELSTSQECVEEGTETATITATNPDSEPGEIWFTIASDAGFYVGEQHLDPGESKDYEVPYIEGDVFVIGNAGDHMSPGTTTLPQVCIPDPDPVDPDPVDPDPTEPEPSDTAQFEEPSGIARTCDKPGFLKLPNVDEIELYIVEGDKYQPGRFPFDPGTYTVRGNLTEGGFTEWAVTVGKGDTDDCEPSVFDDTSNQDEGLPNTGRELPKTGPNTALVLTSAVGLIGVGAGLALTGRGKRGRHRVVSA